MACTLEKDDVYTMGHGGLIFGSLHVAINKLDVLKNFQIVHRREEILCINMCIPSYNFLFVRIFSCT